MFCMQLFYLETCCSQVHREVIFLAELIADGEILHSFRHKPFFRSILL